MIGGRWMLASRSLPLRSSCSFFRLPYRQNSFSVLRLTPLSVSSSRSRSSGCLIACSISGKQTYLEASNGFDDELSRLLALLPVPMRRKLPDHPEFLDLMEVVMDLGRLPLARFPSGDFFLSDVPVSFSDLHHATSLVGDFADDNRAGISRTLHRISAIRNRNGAIIGLTCRVGRAVSGSADMVRDLVQDGVSLLLIGPPGVGKTTLIREIARMLADDYNKRVMIVDTSNEIGGDGDIPHAGIGSARRMQVPCADMQHKVLIEAVENHMPQVIVIDEIGTKLEALAASTISQRGIQLVATAHGVTFENLIMNPSLDILVGGTQSVTLGDEEATRRGVQKSILERKGPATFNCGVEIISKTELRVHRSLEETVDSLLAGRFPRYEVRSMNAKNLVHERTDTLKNKSSNDITSSRQATIAEDSEFMMDHSNSEPVSQLATLPTRDPSAEKRHICLYTYGIIESNFRQAIEVLQLGDALDVTDDITKATTLLASQSKLRNSRIQGVARSLNIPVYATKTSSTTHISRVISRIMNEHAYGMDFHNEHADESLKDINEYGGTSSEKIDAQEEARLAIEQTVIPKGQQVDLLPRSQSIIAMQMDLVKTYQLHSEKVGKEPKMRLRIFPYDCKGRIEQIDRPEVQNDTDSSGYDDTSVSPGRLPILPD